MKIGVNRATIFSAGLVIVPFGVWLFLFGPMLQQFSSTETDIVTEQGRQDALESRIVDPTVQERKIADVAEKQEYINQYFFSEQNALQLFDTFEQLAVQHSVTMDFHLGTAAANPESIALQFSMEGSYAGILSFVEDLNRLPALMHMDDFTITKTSTETAYAATLTANIFTTTTPSQ